MVQVLSGSGQSMWHQRRLSLKERQRYREGQEDLLGALALVVNIIMLWNTTYIDVTLAQLLQEGYPIRDEDAARLPPFVHERHINLLGRYSFAVPDEVTRGKRRPLRNPNDA